MTPTKKAPAATTPRWERGRQDTMRSSKAMELLGFPPHSRSSHLRYDPNPVGTVIRPVESVGDGGGILALGLGLDGGDLEDLCVGVR
jgi:hypothetical protein